MLFRSEPGPSTTGAPPAGQIPAANPQEASGPTGAAPAQQTGTPGSVEQPRPAETPAPAPAQGK